jgi:enamine deaminase RidA (YjgF/YER057c/UK114 family)
MRTEAPVVLAREKAAVHPSQPERRIRTSEASTVVRRFSGPAADELFLLCRPGDRVAAAARQAETVYEAMLDALAVEGVGPEVVVSETVFFRRIRDDFEVVRSARSRVLGGAGLDAYRPATTFVGQPPLGEGAHLELAATAVLPRPRGSSSAHDVIRTLACSCTACSRGVRARVVPLGDQTYLYAGNIYGSGRDPFEEAYDMFRVAEGLLADAAMYFGNVIRTWIHLRDIDRDYDALNEARREFFRHCRLERKPASTGVQGIPLPDAHDVSMSLYAVKSARPLDVTLMSTPSLNEAWSYGSDFSRGLRLAEANRVSLYVSGTASIDEAGRTVHVGNFEAQVDRMLHNIASLLSQQGASFEDLVSGVTYLKNASDAPVLRSMLHERGFDGFPCALVEASLCRPELLCEAEAVAMLPLARAGT